MEWQRDMAEYAMAFHNPKGVESVQKSRELHEMNENKEFGDIFTKQVEHLFGKRLDYSDLEKTREKTGASHPVYIPEKTTPNSIDSKVDNREEVDEIIITKPSKKNKNHN